MVDLVQVALCYWLIQGPTEEETRELDDDDGEQLHELLEPMLQEIKDSKARLKELRRKRLEAQTVFIFGFK